MSNKFNWDDDDGDFRDIPDEVSGRSTPQPMNIPAPPQQQVEDQSYERTQYIESDDYSDVEEDYSSVLSDARLRLEQGRLYEMIMNHDLFGDHDADPKAIATVQKQIRRFAKEQMEIMLGMRQPAQASESFNISLPFNSLEVKALKDLAFVASKGATETEESEEYVAAVAPRRRPTGLNKIGGLTQPRLPSTPPQRREQPQTRPLAKAPIEPVRRVKIDPNLERELRSEGIEREFIEEAKRQLATERTSDKAIDSMTREELAERNRQSALRSRQQVKAPDAMPMATPDQMQMIAMQAASAITQSPGLTRVMELVNRATRK